MQLCSDFVALSTLDEEIAVVLCAYVMGMPEDAVGCGYQAASAATGSTPNGQATCNPNCPRHVDM